MSFDDHWEKERQTQDNVDERQIPSNPVGSVRSMCRTAKTAGHRDQQGSSTSLSGRRRSDLFSSLGENSFHLHLLDQRQKRNSFPKFGNDLLLLLSRRVKSNRSSSCLFSWHCVRMINEAPGTAGRVNARICISVRIICSTISV